jgi:hypothetical protein
LLLNGWYFSIDIAIFRCPQRTDLLNSRSPPVSFTRASPFRHDKCVLYIRFPPPVYRESPVIVLSANGNLQWFFPEVDTVFFVNINRRL